MNLKARLTLSFVLLAVLLAGTISCVDLAGEINEQFAATLERAENLRTLASDLVGLSLNRQLSKPLGEAVRDREVSTVLRDTMLASHAIVEIAVLSPEKRNSRPIPFPTRSANFCSPTTISAPWSRTMAGTANGACCGRRNTTNCSSLWAAKRSADSVCARGGGSGADQGLDSAAARGERQRRLVFRARRRTGHHVGFGGRLPAP